ncbi:MAG: hypothetical protein ACR2M3_11455 [Thermomicrobiales bacterium]
MEHAEGEAQEISTLLSVTGRIGARSSLHGDVATLNALINDLLAFVYPHSDGYIYSDEPRIYHTTVEGRSLLARALDDDCIAALRFGVNDPAMPHEYRGTTTIGPDITIGVHDSVQARTGLMILLTPRWSEFQAQLATRLLSFIPRWSARLDARSASVGGANESETQTGYTFYHYTAPDSEPQTEYMHSTWWDRSELLESLTGATVPVLTNELAMLRNSLTLPIRLLDTLCYLNGSDFVVVKGAVALILTDPITFNLYFDRPLTTAERHVIRVAINAWEDEFYARFDDGYYFPTPLSVCGSVVRWTVRAAEGHGGSVDTSGNGVNTRALKELQDWLLLLPNVEAIKLVLGTEMVG